MFLIFDTETTGLPRDWNAPLTDANNWPRCVQIAWQLHDKDGNCIVACDKEYFRPLEVDTLLGDSRKAKRDLKWQPKTSIKKLVSEMVNFDLKKLMND